MALALVRQKIDDGLQRCLTEVARVLQWVRGGCLVCDAFVWLGLSGAWHSVDGSDAAFGRQSNV